VLFSGLVNFGSRALHSVAGVIIGTRLGVTQHIIDNARVFGFALDAGDHATIETLLAKSPDLIKLIGDCGDEYR
jgi:hypothetical protein